MYFVFDIETDPPKDYYNAGEAEQKPVFNLSLSAWAGLWIENNGTPRQQLTWSGRNEKEGLQALFKALNQFKDFGLIHMGGRQLHQPLIQYKAMQYQLVQPYRLSSHEILYRYSNQNLDLKDLLSNYGATPTSTLKELASFLKIPIPAIPAARKEQDKTEEHNICLSNVMAIYVIWLHLQFSRGNLNEHLFKNLKQRALAKIETLQL